MNPEKLIECVRAYSGLYDLSDKKYSDSAWKDQTWKSIGEELNQPVKCHRKNRTSTTRAAKGHDANVLKELSNYQNKSKQEIQLKEPGLQKVVHENLKNSVTNVCNRILREQKRHENET
ncbi:hypothetical protein ACI65C_000858 [Semiaphis heraclei]